RGVAPGTARSPTCLVLWVARASLRIARRGRRGRGSRRGRTSWPTRREHPMEASLDDREVGSDLVEFGEGVKPGWVRSANRSVGGQTDQATSGVDERRAGVEVVRDGGRRRLVDAAAAGLAVGMRHLVLTVKGPGDYRGATRLF